MARKRFGQHFLHDSAVIDRIVRAINPKPDDAMVEIGPGQGALTSPLLESCDLLDAIELDRDLIDNLLQRFGARGLRLHNADALKFDFSTLRNDSDQPLRIAGNLPYNISTPLLFHLFTFNAITRDMHFMVQEEVANRLASVPGSGSYGRLSVMAQYFCDIEYLFGVGPEAFDPPPKVDSAVIRLIPHQTAPVQLNSEQQLSNVVTQAFSLRRKTLRNSLAKLLEPSDIEACGIDPGRRAETLSLEEFACLANRLNPGTSG